MRRRIFIAETVVGLAGIAIPAAFGSALPPPTQPISAGTARGQAINPVFDSERPYRGKIEAPVTIVEYGDFTCPFTSASRKAVDATLNTRNGVIRYCFKHLPLDKHEVIAATCARYFEAVSANYPDIAWAYFDDLFEFGAKIRLASLAAAFTPKDQQHPPTDNLPELRKITEAAGVSLRTVDLELQYPTVASQLRGDIFEAKTFDINETPTFVVNGTVLRGSQSVEALTAAVQAAMGARQ